MAHSTDQTLTDTGSVGRVLAAVARHLTTTKPYDGLEAWELPVLLGAEIYLLGGRTQDGRTAALSKAAVAAAPAVPKGIVRHEYARLLADAATQHGHEWTDEDNLPVVPPRPVPGPRRSPDKPRIPAQPKPRQGVRR